MVVVVLMVDVRKAAALVAVAHAPRHHAAIGRRFDNQTHTDFQNRIDRELDHNHYHILIQKPNDHVNDPNRNTTEIDHHNLMKP